MKRKSIFVKQKRKSSLSFFDRFVSIIKVIKLELFIALIALIISVGQYFQNSVNARINITTTWRQGYTSETRDHVTRFIYFYKKWRKDCGETNAECNQKIEEAIDILTSKNKLYEYEISKNEYIKELVSNEVEKIKKQATNPCDELTNDQYVVLVLKYRNHIIECLNTLEAVKAVIQSKPLPFQVSIFYKDTLEGRYNDIIEELKGGLMVFIEGYRKYRSERETEAWYVLTSDESYLNDLVNVILYFCVFIIGLITVYLIKTRMQKLGYLRERAS